MAKIRKAVVTAAGKGTRQYPASHTVQKELFPLVDVDGYCKPVLQIIVEEVLASGIEEVCIVTNPVNDSAIRNHFQPLSQSQRAAFAQKPWGLALSDQLEYMRDRLTFVVQEHQEGFGHAVYQAQDFIGDEPFVMLLGDHIYIAPQKRCVEQVVDYYNYNTNGVPIASISTVPEADVARFGIVVTEPIPGSEHASRIKSMVEKPTPELARASYKSPTAPDDYYFCFFGIHALPPVIFDCLKYLIDHDLRDRGEIQFTSAQQILLKESSVYIALSIEGKRYDMGVPGGLVETQVALALNSPFARNIYETVAEVDRQKLAAPKV